MHILMILEIYFYCHGNIFDNTELIPQVFDLDGNQYTYDVVPNSSAPYIEEITFNKIYSFSNFTPKNNKIYCYPYNYLYVTNNIGDNAIYKFEDFSDTNCKFYNAFGLSVGGSGRLVPRNYKGLAEDNDESVTLAKFPTCQWSSDSYTNWLTEQAVNHQTRNLQTATSSIGSALNLKLGDAISTVANSYLQYVNEFYDASLLPQKVAGGNTGDINFSGANNSYKMMRKHPKLEYLRQIDDWFTRFRL